MGDSTREGANAFEPLRPQVFRLEQFLLGQIRMGDEKGMRLAVTVRKKRPAAMDGQTLARSGEDGNFPGPFAITQGRGGGFRNVLWVALQNQVMDQPSEGFFSGPAIEALRGAVPVSDPMVQVAHHDGVVGFIQERGPFAQTLIGGFEIRRPFAHPAFQHGIRLTQLLFEFMIPQSHLNGDLQLAFAIGL